MEWAYLKYPRREICRGVVAVLASACLLAMFNGCIAIPLPGDENEVLAGRRVPDEQSTQLRVGETTKAEVEERLGTPDVIVEDRNVYVYDWRSVGMRVLWFAGAGYSGTGGIFTVPAHHVLLVMFDDGNRVLRVGSTLRRAGVTLGELITEWINEKGELMPPTQGVNQ